MFVANRCFKVHQFTVVNGTDAVCESQQKQPLFVVVEGVVV